MSRLNTTKKQQGQRKMRVRSVITGTAERPRLSVHVSNRHLTAQIIDDGAQKTLVYVSTVGKKNNDSNMVEQAKVLGLELAKKAVNLKITKVVFDRGGRLYHGRIKSLADAAREGGLDF